MVTIKKRMKGGLVKLSIEGRTVVSTLVWWRNVQSSRSVVHGPITWGEFVNQFERRFYLVAFTDKIKTQLERCHQGKKTVAEYEIEFNQIVRFVPHVVHNEYEKATIFR
jgi:hypothetical protein